MKDKQKKGGGFSVNAADYGAIGDGVSDDTVAVRAAIGAVVARGGGVIHLPGSCRILGPL